MLLLTVEFNNLGVTFLDEGKKVEALEMFKAASELMSVVVKGNANELSGRQKAALQDPRIAKALSYYERYCDEDDESDDDDDGDDEDCCVMMDDETSIRPRSPSVPFGSSINNDNINSGGMTMATRTTSSTVNSLIFSQAIRFTHEVSPSYNMTDIAGMCAVMLHNIGLLYQLDAIESGTPDSAHKALQLYEFGYQLLSSSSNAVSSFSALSSFLHPQNDGAAPSSYSPHTRQQEQQHVPSFYGQKVLLVNESSLFYKRVMMRILNNMAHIHYDFMCYEMSTQLLYNLSKMAVDLRASAGYSSVVMKECQQFLLNALLLQPPTRAPAA